MYKWIKFLFLIGVFVFASAEHAPRVFASTVYEYVTKTSSAIESYPLGHPSGYLYRAGFYLDSESVPLSGFGEVRLPMAKQGSPTAGLVLKIFNASDATTLGSLVATSNEFDGSVLPADYSAFASVCPQIGTANDFTDDCFTASFVFSSSQTLVSGDYFLIVERADESSDSSNYYNLYGRESGSVVGQWKATCNTGTACTVNDSRAMFMQVLSGAPVDVSTRIDTVIPANASTTATSTALSVGFSGYVNEDDWVSGEYLKIEVRHSHDSCLQAAGVGFLNCDVRLSETYANVVDGTFSYSTTTPATQIGEYTINAGVYNPRWYWWDEEVVATSTYFTAVEPTWLDQVYSSHATSSPFHLEYQNTATSTEAVKNMCNPMSWGFSVSDCLLALMIPQNTEGFAQYTRTQVLQKWPIGYITDLVDIFSATTTSSLTVLEAVVPPGIPGTGATISLDLSHSLDYVLNATSSQFSSGSATSTETLFEITNYYWKIVVYVFAGLYVLRRVLGSHLIPMGNLRKKKNVN